MPRALPTILLLCACLCAQDKQALTADEIQLLIELGIDDAEVAEQIEANGYALSDDEREALLEVCGPAVRALLRPPAAPKPLTAADVVARIEAGQSADEVIAALEASGSTFDLAPTDVLSLKRAGVPQEVLQVMLESKPVAPAPLSLAEIVELSAAGTTAEALRARIEASDTRIPLAAADLLELRRAGVPVEIIALLKERASEPAPAHVTYTHPTYAFAVRYPSGWKLDENVKETNLHVELGSERGWGCSFDVVPSEQGAWDPDAALDNVLLPMARQAMRKVELQERLRADFGLFTFVGAELTGEHEEQPLRARWLVGMADEALFIVSAWAPAADWEEASAAFDGVLASLRIPARPLIRQPESAPAIEPDASNRAIVDALLPSVVLITTFREDGVDSGEELWGWGTGFIVHERGFVLTNRHVVQQGRAGQAARAPLSEFVLTWDRSLDKAPVRAELMGISEKYDIACLRIIDPGTFQPVRLADIADVRSGDDALVLGFPRPDRQGTLQLSTNSGTIAAVETDREGRVLWVRHMVRTDQGNSGGPLVDKSVGGVAGLHTLVRRVARSDGDPDDRHEMSWAAVPIHQAIREFPQVTAGEDWADFRVEEREQRASFFYGQQRYGAAALECRWLLDEDPSNVIGLSYLALISSIQGDRETTMDCAYILGRDHAEDPVALRHLVSLHLSLGQLEEATRFADTLATVDAKNHEAQLLYARCLRQAGRYAEALTALETADRLTRGKNPHVQLALAGLYFMKAHAERQIYQAGGRWVCEQSVVDKVTYHCEKSLELKPTENDDVWVLLASLAIRQNDAEQAVTYLRKGLDSSPRSVNLRVIAAEIFFTQLRDFPACLDFAQQSLAIEETAAGFFWLGGSAFALGNQTGDRVEKRRLFDTALGALDRSLQLAPRGAWAPTAHYFIGSIQLQLGATEKAVDSFRRTLDLSPGHTDATDALRSLGRLGGG